MTRKSGKSKKMAAPASGIYRRIAVTFFLAALVLLGAVFYVAFSRATIILTPKKEVLTAEFTIPLRSRPAAGEARGLVLEQILEESQTFPVEGEGIPEPAAARGQVVIKNLTSRDQPLVKTTRLLTPDNKLFRLTKTVIVPAQGQIEVKVLADQPGPEGEIEPTRFTIPGLWEGLRDKIYAESASVFCCGSKLKLALTEEMFTRAEQNLEAQMLEAAKDEMRMQAVAEKLDGDIFLAELVSVERSGRAGEERDSFDLMMKIKTTGIFYETRGLAELARRNLRLAAGEERELVELDQSRMKVAAQEINLDEGTARLKVEAPGLLVLRTDSVIFDLGRLTGLEAEAARAYFERFRSIEAVEIKFLPFWQSRLPKLKNRIEVKIAE